jgi:hypothetical protein
MTITKMVSLFTMVTGYKCETTWKAKFGDKHQRCPHRKVGVFLCLCSEAPLRDLEVGAVAGCVFGAGRTGARGRRVACVGA